MGSATKLRARVYYDFASTLCYVAHRVFGELEPRLLELGVELDWCPLDLAELLGWRRGVPVDEARLANAERVAAELGVAVRPLPIWPDSRDALAAALVLADGPREATFRERLWVAAFEERREIDAPGALASLARDLGIGFEPEDIDRARTSLERITREASEQGVTGLPTVMLGAFPFPGMQSRETTLLVFERWARKNRPPELVG
jgi:predicted DsbA family dithiol-disulfide isomerase